VLLRRPTGWQDARNPAGFEELMKVLVVSTHLLWPSHYETELEIMQNHLAAGDTVVQAVCDAELPACDMAVVHRDVRCYDCMRKRKRGLALLDGAVTTVPLLGDAPVPTDVRTEFPDAAALAAYSVDGFDVGAAVASSIISELRDPNPSTVKYRDSVRGYVTSTVQLYRGLQAWLARNPVDRVYAFNGRFAHTRAVLRACQAAKVECYLHERGHDIKTYGLYRNALPHDIARADQRMRDAWAAAEGRPDREAIASAFFTERVGGVAQAWYSFTAHQDESLLPEGWDAATTRVILYNSSEDEYAAVGDEWKHTIYESQLDGVRRIAKDLEAREGVRLFVRMHPNNRTMVASEQAKWTGLRSPILTVIPPESKVSSYALLRAADLVITFGSTVGIEATFFGKPSILADPALYERLGGTYNPASHEELMSLLRPGLPPKDRTAALVYGYYLKTFGLPYRWFDAVSFSEGRFKGVDLARRPGRVKRWLARLAGVGMGR
jgi:hypothetical protein